MTHFPLVPLKNLPATEALEKVGKPGFPGLTSVLCGASGNAMGRTSVGHEEEP